MRVAIITESFPPDVNGVANSVLRVAEQLVVAGHHPLVVAPAAATARRSVPPALPYPVVRIPSLPLPGYPGLRLGLPARRRLVAALREHDADVVHLASPFVLGAGGGAAARRLGLPVVAVFQTDVPGYARAYRMGLGEEAAWRWIRHIHARAARTLAPSTQTASELLTRGIPRVWLWRRGVDTTLFDPARRSALVRAVLAPKGEVLVGYVGRLAVEKRVDLLHQAALLPGVRVIVIGDGPARTAVRRSLPTAAFLGERRGVALATLCASLDIFVHTGALETFGQAVQEALASGVPVVAPAAGGPLDLVDPGHTGLLVRPGDAGAVALAVAELAADPERRRRYGVAARASVAGRTWGAVTAELIAHYEAALGRAPVPDRAPVPNRAPDPLSGARPPTQRPVGVAVRS